MKILITTEWYKPAVNGVVTSVTNLEEGLREFGHEVKILTLSATHASHVEGDVYYVGSTGIGKIYPHARVRTAYAGNLIKELIEWSPDVVHSQSEFSTFFMAKRIARACRCPLVHTYHTVYEKYTQYFSPNEAMGRHMAGIFSRRVLAPVDSVIVPTAKVKTLLEGYGVETPIYEVPTGLDLSRLEKKDGAPSVTRADFGLSSQDKVFLYTGRLAKEKNISELLELMRVEAPEGSKLLLVGDGPYREFLEDYVYRLDMQDRVVFAGMADPDNMGDYYRLGDVFVSASRSETQGLTYLEAMACGLPLLCRKDACLEKLVEDGTNGYLYDSPEGFRHAAETLAGSAVLRYSIGQEAAETIRRGYSRQSFAGKAAKVYRESIAEYDERKERAEEERHGFECI